MKKLIIVCDDKRMEFGGYLTQLISSEDDVKEVTIGTKDGTVAAQLWTEKEYRQNSLKISSDQHMLFIGNSKLVKEKKSHMKTVFSNYGIEYGWLGRQAAISVEKVVSLKEYENFIEFAQMYENNIEQLMCKKTKFEEAIDEGVNIAGIKISGKTLAIIATPISLAPIIVVGAGIPITKKLKLIPQIEKQMYSCAVMKFYLENLSAFLGLD